MNANNTQTLLLVEDDDAHAELVEYSLGECEETPVIRRARDGEEALHYLFDPGSLGERDGPDLVLLDLNLPRVGGHEVLKRLKASERLCSVPVIILSTSGSTKDCSRAYRNHANAYLIKPADFESFYEMIRNMWIFWGTWNHQIPASHDE